MQKQASQMSVCDDEAPKCTQCRNRGLECVRMGPNRQFRNGSSANYDGQFSGTQSWVNSNVKEFRLQTGPRRVKKRIPLADEAITADPTTQEISSDPSNKPINERVDPLADNSSPLSSQPAEPGPTNTSDFGQVILRSISSHENEQLHALALASCQTHSSQQHLALSQRDPSWGGILHTLEPPERRDVPLESVQEACLLRYFIEELSPWRLYQLVVPERARRYPPLLNAILAMSTRHLCRCEKYRTPQGIVYRGQHLPHLSPGSAVEYMLKCIPVLKDFHTTRDGEIRELIVTTAVILRHFEELDDEEEEDSSIETRLDGGVNFLAILNAVLRSLTSDDLVRRRELLSASFWVALRQEVYFALRKGFPPQMVEPPAEWADISPANKLVLHTRQVTKWLFEDKSESGWQKLKEQEEYLDQHVCGRFTPILFRPPDRVSGEVFPTMWYASPIALTGMQHMMIAKMILVGESPFLSRSEDVRSAYRIAEGEVKKLLLEWRGPTFIHRPCFGRKMPTPTPTSTSFLSLKPQPRLNPHKTTHRLLGASTAAAYLASQNPVISPLPANDPIWSSRLFRRANPNGNPATNDVCIKRIPFSKIRPELLKKENDLSLEFCRGLWSGWGYAIQRRYLDFKYRGPETENQLWDNEQLATSTYDRGTIITDHFEVVEKTSNSITVRCGDSPRNSALRPSDGLFQISATIDKTREEVELRLKSVLFSSEGKVPGPKGPMPGHIEELHQWYARIWAETASWKLLK
ncbi:hypothetical protein FAVG1_04622 [Fusarium avenaceum]|nr:hypothetical protein FAVG1_04622 [Fusarium avenaceum]